MDAPFEILESIANGDQASFKKLYYLFCNNVYNIALSYTKNEEQAEEIVQDVFTKIYQNADKFKGNSTISTWIYRITVNTSINHIKKEKRLSLFKFGSNEIDRCIKALVAVFFSEIEVLEHRSYFGGRDEIRHAHAGGFGFAN